MGKAPVVTMMWVDMLSKLQGASLLLRPGLSFTAYELWGLQGLGFRV